VLHSVPGWVETLRGVILLVVWAVLILRIPALWRSRQRPVWIVLLAMATGSVMIQAPVAQWIDGATGVAKASELAVALVALTDFAAVWWFAVALHRAGHHAPVWLRRAPLVCAATVAVLAVAFFTVTPGPDRFGEQARGWWVGYAIVWIVYGAITAVGAAAIFWRHGITMRSPVLRVSVLVLAIGTSAELPYLAVRAVRWFSSEAPPTLVLVGFWFSFTRFVLVAMGCSLAALEPLRKASLYWYRRQRLYGLWLLLRQATPELVVVAPRSRWTDLLTFGNTWEQLHQRVVDIRDSITSLHDGWASPELLRRASLHAEKGGRPERMRLVATACWIEVTRRDAVAGAPKLHHEVDKDLLPEVHAGESTMRREVRYLLRLHRALRSRPVHTFAETIQHGASATTG
jgi:hypothetical protein